MTYKMFLDDERDPPRNDRWTNYHFPTWVVVRSFDEFVQTIMEQGVPAYISFDHDLGEGKSGMDCAKWLVEAQLDRIIEIPTNFDFYVHSQNPVGARNIDQLLNQFLISWKIRQFTPDYVRP